MSRDEAYAVLEPAQAASYPDASRYMDVQVIGNLENEHQSSFSIFCGDREFSMLEFGDRLFQEVATHITNQRESGKWFTRSPVHECGNLISNAGSAYAVLALQACGELPDWPFGKTKPADK